MSNSNKDKNRINNLPYVQPGGKPQCQETVQPLLGVRHHLPGADGMFFFGQDTTMKEVKWSDFQEYVRDNRIKSLVVYTTRAPHKPS